MVCRATTIGLIAGGALVAAVFAQSSPFLPRDHPAIEYSTRPTTDPVARLNQRLQDGQTRLSVEKPGGYLRSVLKALDIPVSSQTLVLSANSVQRDLIGPATPRAIYFNDAVAVGVAKGGDTIEVSAQDPAQGVVFYQLSQEVQATPQFVRKGSECLQCHYLTQTNGVPGLFVNSVLPLSDNVNEYVQGWATDHRTPIEDRWGGWYVTGAAVPDRHLGNVPVAHVPRSYVRADVAPRLKDGQAAFDTSTYLSPYSDVVALLVLDHQMHMTNLITRLGWEARIAEFDSRSGKRTSSPEAVADAVDALVDYMLFVEEAPLPVAVRGSTSFAEDFASKGPRDTKGRSLRDLDLTRRLLHYPCSYMIYTDAFEALPGAAKSRVYQRLWEVLSGKETGPAYAGLTAGDRRAILEILRDTKPGLPEYFR